MTNMATSGDQRYIRSVVVTQLPEACDEETLMKFCHQYLPLEKMLMAELLPVKGHKAYIIFGIGDIMEEAVATLNHKEFQGTKVKVKAATIEHALELEGARKIKYMDQNQTPDVDGLLQQLLACSLSPEDKQKIAATIPTLIAALGPETETEGEVKVEPKPQPPPLPKPPVTTGAPPYYPAYAPSSLRISTFSGDPQGKGGEVSFKQWRFEVMGLVNDGNLESHIMQTIRKSVRGAASETLLSVGEKATLHQLLKEMDTVFGSVASTQKLLQDFYQSQQTDKDSVSQWASNITSQLAEILRRPDSMIGLENKKLMLQRKFFYGLNDSQIKSGVRHLFDQGVSYERLVEKARELELELAEKRVRVQEATATDLTSQMSRKLDQVLAKMQSLEDRLEKTETRNQGNPNHANRVTGHTNSTNTNNGQNRESASGTERRRFPGKCFACGQVGHRKMDCPVNSQQPASGGRR